MLVNESGITRKCAATLQLGPLPVEPAHAIKIVLYRCAQECISNVLRHSGASHFSMSVTAAAGTTSCMKIEDNGRGIPDDAARRGGIGLDSIREHEESVDGILSISSDLEGTTIQISLPLMED